ncbi:kremen protein 2-like isoform X1 [Branchiostoma lanceolatum]|uniref:kremen protein 2-like isoform X1 n=1 Tax=Branchiostoma lanceolatum TaxID=7740 RepID=UPI003456ED79
MKGTAFQVATLVVLALMLAARGQELVEVPPEAPAAHGGHEGIPVEGLGELSGFLAGLFGLLGGLGGGLKPGAAPKKWREDYQCGPDYPAEDGNPAECDPDGIYPCCSPYSWCGITPDHCDCPGCTDYREPGSGTGPSFRSTDAVEGELTWRNDNRCGWGFPAEGAEEAECNPNGVFACCSPYGWCGVAPEYCDCPGCIDYGHYGVRNLGCYTDSKERMMSHGPEIFRNTLTNDICLDYCREMGYAYAGTEYYEECFCGTEEDFARNLEGKEILYESCDTPCVGDDPSITTMCGGAWKLSVFKVGSAK